MALTATPRSTTALRGSTGRTDRRTALADAHDEITALRAERDSLIVELERLRDRIAYAFGLDDWHMALSVRDRLGSLSASLRRRAA